MNILTEAIQDKNQEISLFPEKRTLVGRILILKQKMERIEIQKFNILRIVSSKKKKILLENLKLRA